MAAHVCFRLCGWHAFQQIRRSVVHLPRTSLLASTASVTPVTFLSPGCRLHHAFTLATNARIRSAKKFTFFQRGFRSKRSENRRVVIRPFRDPADSGDTNLLGSLAFTAFVCGSSFVGAMIWQYESLRSRAQEMMKGLERSIGRMFQPGYDREGFRGHMNAMWHGLSDGQRMVVGIIFCNALVFLAWKNPHFHPVLMRYFTSMPGNPPVSMLLSAFSHYNLWHIAANMYVLWSFAPVSLNLFGREQWLAVFLSSAVLSSMASLTHKVVRRMPVSPSLGASGAIMCLLGAVCVRHPDARLSIAFVGELFPHSFSAGSALKFMVALDTVGLFMGWKVFDHAAHLGGVLFGIWYATYGHKIIWGQREAIMRQWHEFRGKQE